MRKTSNRRQAKLFSVCKHQQYFIQTELNNNFISEKVTFPLFNAVCTSVLLIVLCPLLFGQILMNAASSQEFVRVEFAPTPWEVISASAPGVMSHLWAEPALLVGATAVCHFPPDPGPHSVVQANTGIVNYICFLNLMSPKVKLTFVLKEQAFIPTWCFKSHLIQVNLTLRDHHKAQK